MKWTSATTSIDCIKVFFSFHILSELHQDSAINSSLETQLAVKDSRERLQNNTQKNKVLVADTLSLSNEENEVLQSLTNQFVPCNTLGYKYAAPSQTYRVNDFLPLVSWP